MQSVVTGQARITENYTKYTRSLKQIVYLIHKIVDQHTYVSDTYNTPKESHQKPEVTAKYPQEQDRMKQVCWGRGVYLFLV